VAKSNQIKTKICQSILIPDGHDDIMVVRLHPAKRRHILRNIGVLYDILADALHEVNEVFSMEVRFLYKRILKTKID
jgi:L-rhamnose isomerase